MFAGKKSAQIREILISESAWEEMTCLFAPSLCAGNKSNDKAFYEKLIRIADDEFTRHLTSLETAK